MPVGFTPIYRITKDDTDITDRFNDRLISLQVQLSNGGASSDLMSIALDNRDYKLATPDIGTKLRIELGYEEIGLADQGVYEIDDFEFRGPAHTLVLTGNSVGFLSALKAPAFKAHDGRTVGDIVGEIARIGGAQPAVSAGLAGEKVPFFNQAMSPLHMLHELERRFGAIAKFEDGRLVFKPRGNGDSFSGKFMPTLILRPWMFASEDGYSVRFSSRTAFARTMVPWKDQSTGGTKWVSEDNPNYRNVQGQKQQVFKYEKLMNSQEEAKKMAKSMVDMLRRQECEANFKLAKGDPWVRDQMPIIVEDMFDPVNGSYVAEDVVHTYTKQPGIVTTIKARLPNTPLPFKRDDSFSFLGLNTLEAP